jgi:hypothetical protein
VVSKAYRIWVTLIGIAVSLPAYGAEPSAQERETARRLMDDGDAKTSEKDYAHATEAYQKAHAIMHVPSTGLELARSYERQGRLVEARDLALDVLRMPKVPREPEAFQRARVDATKLADTLASRVGTLTIEVTGIQAASQVRVSVDGTVVSETVRGIGFAADPGKHSVEASAPGYSTAKLEVEVPEGGRVPATLRLEPSEVVAAPPPVVTAESTVSTVKMKADPPIEPESHGVRGLTIGLLGAGGASLLVGGITGALSISKTSELKDACPSDRCPSGRADDLSSARTLAWVSNIGLGVGVIASGVGIAFLVSDLSSKPSASGRSLKPIFSVSPQGGYLGLGGNL